MRRRRGSVRGAEEVRKTKGKWKEKGMRGGKDKVEA